MTDSINLELVNQVVSVIPVNAWPLVKDGLVNAIVDNMPSDVLKQLTGDPCGFDRAEQILRDYYAEDKMHNDLIVDSFRILGDEYTCQVLDSIDFKSHGISTGTSSALQPMQERKDVDFGVKENKVCSQTEEDV